MPTQLALKPIAFLTSFLLCTANGFAQMPNPYGPPINLENAKRFAVPAFCRSGQKRLDDGRSSRGSRWKVVFRFSWKVILSAPLAFRAAPTNRTANAQRRR